MRMVDALERAELHWCCIGGIAVNHWAIEPMVTRDVDFVVAVEEVDRAVTLLESTGFSAERHDSSVSFKGRSAVSLQLSTEGFYREFPARAVPADVHGILLRVAALEDTLARKIKAWRTPQRRPSKTIKDLADIARLVEAHPHLRSTLPEDVRARSIGERDRGSSSVVVEERRRGRASHPTSIPRSSPARRPLQDDARPPIAHRDGLARRCRMHIAVIRASWLDLTPRRSGRASSPCATPWRSRGRTSPWRRGSRRPRRASEARSSSRRRGPRGSRSSGSRRRRGRVR